jgi:hypothetical protein
MENPVHHVFDRITQSPLIAPKELKMLATLAKYQARFIHSQQILE